MNKIKLPRWLFEDMQKSAARWALMVVLFCSKGHFWISNLESNRYKKLCHMLITLFVVLHDAINLPCVSPNFVDTHFVFWTCISDTKIKVGSRNPWKIGVGKKLMVIIVLLKNHLKWDFLKTQHEIGTSVKNVREIVRKNIKTWWVSYLITSLSRQKNITYLSK